MEQSQWTPICQHKDLIPNSGVCAKLGQAQVAIFYCKRSEKIYALCNYDPFGQAYVLSRGIIGSIEDTPVVASPLYKQHFNLETGECLEDATVKLKTYPVRIHDGQVQLRQPELAHA